MDEAGRSVDEARVDEGRVDEGRRAGLVRDLASMIRFNSRLVVPSLAAGDDPAAPPDFTRAGRTLPIAAIVIALPAAFVLWGGGTLGLPPLVAAGLALAVLVMTTGAFHEDGLADTADGFGGGWTVPRKLEIMRDSRIGTYGGVALGLSLLLRAAALAELLVIAKPGGAALAFVVAAIVSRVLPLGLFHALPPARTDGLSASGGRPTRVTVLIAWAFGAVLALAVAAPAFGVGRTLAAMLIAALAVAALGLLARRQIRGQTGDVLGASQQVAEIAFLVVLLI